MTVATRKVTLFILGGVAGLKGEQRSPSNEFSVAFVGPLSSMISVLTPSPKKERFQGVITSIP